MSQQRLGKLLVGAGLLDQDGLAHVLEVQARDGGSLGRIAAELGLADEESVARAIAAGLTLPFSDLVTGELPDAAGLPLPPKFCQKRLIVPLGIKGRSVRLAMANPLDHATIQDVESGSLSYPPILIPHS